MKQLLIDIKAIIESEARNTNFITLYKSESGWQAYEQSAFHLTTIFKTGREYTAVASMPRLGRDATTQN